MHARRKFLVELLSSKVEIHFSYEKPGYQTPKFSEILVGMGISLGPGYEIHF
jgi:hypothetical protein